MNRHQLLDCTLRDGAQVNEARFGEKAVTDIIQNLRDAGIEMIECGFLKDVDFEPGRTYYPQPSFAEKYIPEDKGTSTYTALVDYNRYDIDHLEEYSGKSFDYIRVSLFEKDIMNITQFCKKVKDKGYRLSIQPMDTYSYTDDDLKRIIEVANDIYPETLAIVDTYSIAQTQDVERVYKVYEKNLDKGIKIGFHSHNNQLNSFALARKVMEVCASDRSLVIDCSLYGMGRGGGNLNTELFTEYMNRAAEKDYKIKPILDSIDQYMVDFKQRFEWGYSIPMLLAGLFGVHVFTVAYLEKKPGITSYDLLCIFEMLDPQKRKRYDYDYIDSVYAAYMAKKAQE